jgi:hypothetical protein
VVEEKEGRLERRALPPARMLSREGRAGVERPEALMEGWRLRLVRVVSLLLWAAMARSMEAWETPEKARLGELAEWGWVDGAALAALVEMLVRAGAPVEMVALRPDMEEEDRARREGVGCVAPVIWWVGFGSLMSTGRMDCEEVEEWEALLATDAVCARRAVSSRVRRLT